MSEAGVGGIGRWAGGVLAGVALAGGGAQAAPVLGLAQSFAVMGASTVTNTGLSAVVGDLGVFPGGSVTGLASLTLVGSVHAGDAAAQLAQADALVAYSWAQGLAVDTDLSGQDLGGMVLTPGVYHFAGAAALSGLLVLDAQNDPNAQFVFQVATTLTTGSASGMNVLNGGAGMGVYWQVGSSATLGTGTRFAGNLLADQSITLDTGASILCGRALALVGAVTLDSNLVSSDCFGLGDLSSGRLDFGSVGFSGGLSPVPEPAAAALWALGLAGLGAWRLRTWYSRRR